MSTQVKTKEPTRRTQAERIATSKNEILHAAVTLIALKGPTDWTLSEIGKNAGYTGGLVSHRFGSKNGLLLAVTDRIVELFLDKNLITQMKQTTSPDFLISFFKLYIQQLKEGSDLFIAYHRLMAESQSTLPQLRPAFETINMRLRTVFADAIREGQQSGSIKPELDPDYEAYSFTAMFRGITNLWLTGPRDIKIDEYAQYECEQYMLRIETTH
jgi:AcrR family transcriptional regulator